MATTTTYTIDVYEGFHIYPQFNSKQNIDLRTYDLRVGKNGYDKNATLEEIIEQIAVPNQAHVIVRRTPKSKWYVKQIDIDTALKVIQDKKTHYVAHPQAKTYLIRF
jgi:hypothetical protein